MPDSNPRVIDREESDDVVPSSVAVSSGTVPAYYRSSFITDFFMVLRKGIPSIPPVSSLKEVCAAAYLPKDWEFMKTSMMFVNYVVRQTTVEYLKTVKVIEGGILEYFVLAKLCFPDFLARSFHGT